MTELSDPRCTQLFSYLDLRQGARGRFARGDQAIADALGWQARTVRAHALHLAGAGWIRVHKHVTETGAHKATEYEVIHNPARKRSNQNRDNADPRESGTDRVPGSSSRGRSAQLVVGTVARHQA